MSDSEIPSAILPTPFLDADLNLSTPNLVSVGDRLQPIANPPISTLISQRQTPQQSLQLIAVNNALESATPSPSRPTTGPSNDVGITLDLDLLTTGVQPKTQPSSGQTMGRQIPQNMREARSMLPLISPQRSGKRNEHFAIKELQQIARNLNLPASGQKAQLANRIRSAVIEYFNLPKE